MYWVAKAVVMMEIIADLLFNARLFPGMLTISVIPAEGFVCIATKQK